MNVKKTCSDYVYIKQLPGRDGIENVLYYKQDDK